MLDPRVAAFFRDAVLPAFEEIAASQRIKRDFTIHLYNDAIDEPLHATLVSMLATDRTIGPVLVIEDRDRARRPAPYGGRYLVAPMLRTHNDVILASPVVMFQMQFDRELHVFQQRYSAISQPPVEKITRTMIVNHVLNSLSYFRIHAMSPTRPRLFWA